MLRVFDDRVDRATDAILDSPYSAILYGLMAYLVTLSIGFYATSQLLRMSVFQRTLGVVALVILAAPVIAITAFGFLIVGTLVTDVGGHRRPTYGLLIGAIISTIGWLSLPPSGGLLVTIALASFGVGGLTRVWFHAERAVTTEQTGK